MLSTSNWRLTPGRRDGSSFRQIRAAMKHRISTPSVSALHIPHMINTSYMFPSYVFVAKWYFCHEFPTFCIRMFRAYYAVLIFTKILIESWSSKNQIYVTRKNKFWILLAIVRLHVDLFITFNVYVFIIYLYICNFIFYSIYIKW